MFNRPIPMGGSRVTLDAHALDSHLLPVQAQRPVSQFNRFLGRVELTYPIATLAWVTTTHGDGVTYLDPTYLDMVECQSAHCGYPMCGSANDGPIQRDTDCERYDGSTHE